MDKLAPVYDLFTKTFTPEHRAYLIQRAADLTVQIALLESEQERLKEQLGESIV